MTTLIAEAFKALFGVIAVLAFAMVVAVAYGTATRLGLGPGLMIAVSGIALVVALIGAIALQIQNNQLLKQIARNTASDQPPAKDAAPSFTPAADGPWPGRSEPPLNRRP
jgi:hypothetical protein